MGQYWNTFIAAYRRGKRRVEVARMRSAIVTYATVKSRPELTERMEQILVEKDLRYPGTEDELMQQLELAFREAVQG